MLLFLVKLFNEPFPVRFLIRKVLAKFSIGSYRFRYVLGALRRPHYGYILYKAAALAQKLGQPKISVIEYGVAGGNGLLSLEYHATEIEKLFPVKIEIYGFDTGKGLPAPQDYRDLPYHWQASFFHMEQDKLEKKLKRSTLVIGNIEETAQSFFEKYKPAPIGAIIHDFDYYSSTAKALTMLNAGNHYYLPRIFCYFDDTIGSATELYNDYTGERRAIDEFNTKNESIKMTIPYYLRATSLEAWKHQIWVCHFFNHPSYNQFISENNQQLPIF